MKYVNITLLFLVASISLAGNTREFVSPDKKTRVLIQNFNEKGKVLESKIQFVSTGGMVLRRKSFTSNDGEHGYGIIRAEWTRDSKFFVFSMISSGGHQPWHCPISVYSTTDNKLFNIDELFGAVTESFRLLSSDSLETSVLSRDDTSRETIVILLSTLTVRQK